MEQLFKKIEEEIKAKRLNKTTIANTIGISRNTVYNLNEGTSIGTIFKIIEALGKTPVQFLTELENETNVAEGAINQTPPTDYKQNYIEILEKLNYANEQLLEYTTKNKKKA